MHFYKNCVNIPSQEGGFSVKNILKRYEVDRLYIGYVNIPTNQIRVEVSPGVYAIKQLSKPSILYRLDENWYQDLDTGTICLNQERSDEKEASVTVEVLQPLKKYYSLKKKECFQFEALRIAKDNYSKYTRENWNSVSFKENRIPYLEY